MTNARGLKFNMVVMSTRYDSASTKNGFYLERNQNRAIHIRNVILPRRPLPYSLCRTNTLPLRLMNISDDLEII